MNQHICMLAKLIALLSVLRMSEVALFGADPLRGEVESAIQSNSADEAARAFHALFHPASANDLQQLKDHMHPSISLRAAWEQVRQTIREDKESIVVQPDAFPLHRFVGFLEGRIGISLPNWWEQALLNASAYERKRIFFPPPEKWPLHRTESGYLAFPDITIVKENNKLVCTVGDRSCHIPSLLVENSRRRGPVKAINVVFVEN